MVKTWSLFVCSLIRSHDLINSLGSVDTKLCSGFNLGPLVDDGISRVRRNWPGHLSVVKKEFSCYSHYRIP